MENHHSHFGKILAKYSAPSALQEDPSSVMPALLPPYSNHPSEPTQNPSMAVVKEPSKLYAHMALSHSCSLDPTTHSTTTQFAVLDGSTSPIHSIALTRTPSGLDITVEATCGAYAQALQQQLPALQHRLGKKNFPHRPYVRIRESDAQLD
jgi:hypothetical protein